MSFWKKIMCCALTLLSIEKSEACTGIVQRAENGDFVYARTLEFGQDLISFDLLFAPRGLNMASMTNNNEKSNAKWKNTYAYVGFSPFGMPILADGLNEKGLACGAFYFPGWAEYQQAVPGSSNPLVSNLDFVSWVLGNFATVEEVINALKKTTVIGLFFEPWGLIPPLHYIVVDEKGNKAVIEYVKGNLNVYEAAVEVITNSPSYDWHLTNARNYIGLKALNRPSIQIEGQDLAAFGQGSGAIGLPGDFTPPSRFIRAGFLNQVVLPGKNGLAQVQRAFKILNQFDIPRGAVREKEKDKEVYEETSWTSAADLANRRYFYHTVDSRVIRFVDLKALDLQAGQMMLMPIKGEETFVDVSEKFSTKFKGDL